MSISIRKWRGGHSGRSRSVLVEPKRAVDSRFLASEEEELLDWDVWLEETPARPERTVFARFEYAGRDKPMPLDSAEVD